MINTITPNSYAYRNINTPKYAPTFHGCSQSRIVAQKSVHGTEMFGRKLMNRISGLFNRKFVNQANEVLSKINRNTPEYIYAIAGAGRIFAQNKEVEINFEDGIIEKLAKSGKPHIFIMNHDNQTADPQMLGFFNTMLNEEYVVTEQADKCPRPRIILNEDILLSMRPKMRNIFEKLGAIGIDASLMGGNKIANGRKMAQIMKEYINGDTNLYIFPEGKKCVYKNLPLNERFQPGIANIIEKLISKTDVSVVPLAFAYNKHDKSLCSMQIGEPIIFEKKSEIDKKNIFQRMCTALEVSVAAAKSKVPQSTLGESVLYV